MKARSVTNWISRSMWIAVIVC